MTAAVIVSNLDEGGLGTIRGDFGQLFFQGITKATASWRVLLSLQRASAPATIPRLQAPALTIKYLH